MTEQSPHFKLGYSLATIKALVEAIESNDPKIIKEIKMKTAIELAKEFMEANA